MESIEKFNLPKCPHCNGKLLYIESFLVKNRIKYSCKYCKKKSLTILNPLFFKLLGVIQILAIIIFAVAIFMGGSFCLLGLGVIIILFSVFYAFSPFMVQLFRIRNKDDDLKYEKKQSGEDTETEIYSN